MRPLKALNDSKCILNDQGGHSDSFEINSESLQSFRTFRGSRFLEQKFGHRTTFLEARYVLGIVNFLFFFCIVLILDYLMKSNERLWMDSYNGQA